MFFNPRYPIILFVLSFLFTMAGLLLKILHWPGGSLVTGSMLMVQGISGVWYVILLFRPKKDNNKM